MIDLDMMNEPQREAVITTEGPLLVLAGAGSGKTRVLTHRASYLVEEMGVNPWNILAITFTNKAAKEMRQRIDDIIGYGASDIYVSTFHSLCMHILFRHADRVGYGTDFEICDASDQKSVIRDVCKKLQIDTKMYKERMLINAISAAKDELIDPVQFTNEAQGDYRKEIIARVYTEYQSTLKHNNTFDFDDLIMKTVQLFKTCPDVLLKYQERFKYIMVDEYQDTNSAQFELIHQLAMKYRNLCVVGDDDQSIYKFRGANIYNILDFEKYYSEAKVVRLEQNYRSTGNILNAANEVIANNIGRKVKRLWTDKEEGDKIYYKQLDNAASEAMYVAEDIKRRVQNEGIKYGDCAILMRTNIQSKEFEDAFRLLQIDYDLVKGLRFWDTKVIKDLTSYILTVASGANDMRAMRIINVPKRGIGNATIDKIQAYAMMNDMSFFDACRKAEDIPGLGRSASKVTAFAYMILRIRGKLDDMSFGEMLDEILAETDYMDYLNDEAETPEKYQEMQEYIEKLREALETYEAETEVPDIIDFMRQNGVEGNNIDTSLAGGHFENTLSPEEEEALREKKVLIMTMHNAKGLEFPYVYLVGMEDGLFPSYMTITGDDPDEIEEERRLCYVAITRAMKRLNITCAKSRMINGEVRYSKSSRFVKEIPFSLINLEEPAGSRLAESKGNSFKRGALMSAPQALDKYLDRAKQRPAGGGYAKPAAKKKVSATAAGAYSGVLKGAQLTTSGQLEYGIGDRVRHIKFGDGTVLEITKGARDFEVAVDFDNAGVKRMFAAFAKLIKL